MRMHVAGLTGAAVHLNFFLRYAMIEDKNMLKLFQKLKFCVSVKKKKKKPQKATPQTISN